MLYSDQTISTGMKAVVVILTVADGPHIAASMVAILLAVMMLL